MSADIYSLESTKRNQARLNEIYQPLVDRSKALNALFQVSTVADSVLKELNGPFLLATNDLYENSSPKAMIFGQENNGWMAGDYDSFLSSKGIQECLIEYRTFNITQYRYGAFKRYFQALQEKIRGRFEDNDRSVLWNNLFKLNHDGKSSLRSPHKGPILAIQGKVVALEVEILRPDIVVFLTGPRYDEIIKAAFSDAQFVPIDGHPVNEVAVVKAVGLPLHAYRTYHPSYLNRVSQRKPHCFGKILERVAVVS